MRNPFEIVRPEGVTTDWLTRALKGRGIDATVGSFTMDVVGTGQLGETRRFNLAYVGTPPADAPASLVGKFSSADKTAAESGKSFGLYKAEVMFYQELADRARIRTPKVYVAELDETNDFALLFEDLAPAKVGDQMRGCTVDQARLALKEAALLHATFWNDLELAKQPWLLVPEGAQAFYSTELMEQAWAYVQKTYPGRLTAEVVNVCDRYVRNHAYWNRPRPLPKCFSHNDFRPDNMLFGGPDGRVAIVDWQTSAFLGAGMDPAYFLGAIFDRETRRAQERGLLKGYYDDLVSLGVSGYSFDQLLRDYAHYSFAAIAVALTATMIVKRTDRGDDLFMHMITGAAHQALDNHALDDLPE